MVSLYVEPAPAQAPTDCTTCGTCCFAAAGDAVRYVPVTGDDHARLGDRADDLVVFVGNKAGMRLEPSGACAALVIAPEGRFTCAVYADRPQTCRDLQRGGPACLGEIERTAHRPREALLSLRPSRGPAEGAGGRR